MTRLQPHRRPPKQTLLAQLVFKRRTRSSQRLILSINNNMDHLLKLRDYLGPGAPPGRVLPATCGARGEQNVRLSRARR